MQQSQTVDESYDLGMARPATIESGTSAKKRRLDEISDDNGDQSFSKKINNQGGNLVPQHSMSTNHGDVASSGRTTAQASSFDGATMIGTTIGDSDTVRNTWAYDIERPATRFPRPASPTPSMSPGFSGEDGLPDGGAMGRQRADSAMSYTSQRPRHRTHASGHTRSNAAIFGGRSGNDGYDSNLFHRLGNFQFQFPSGSNLVRNMQSSHGSSAVDRHGTVHSTQREDSTTGIGSIRSRTGSVLADGRSASRVGNHTGLEVNMPATISPIREEEVGGYGRRTGASSNIENRYESPETPVVFTVQTTRTGSSFGRESIKKTLSEIFRKPSIRVYISGKTVLAITITGSAFAMVSVMAAATSTGTKLHMKAQVPASDIMQRRRRQQDEEWIEMVPRSAQVPIPSSAHLAGSHRDIYRGQANVPPIHDELSHRAVLQRTDRAAQDAAWAHFSSDGVRLRRYVEFLEREFQKNHPEHFAFTSPTDEHKEEQRTSTINAEPLVSPSQLEQDASVRTSTIGIARSASLYESQKKAKGSTVATNIVRPSTPLTNMTASASQASIAAHEDMSPIPLLQRDLSDTVYPRHIRDASTTTTSSICSRNSSNSSHTTKAPTANTSKPSLYPSASVDSLPTAPLVTRATEPSSSHSLAPSTTSGTLDNIIGGYGSSFQSPQQSGYYTPVMHHEASGEVRSHAMATEAGTPNSQKGSRVSSSLSSPSSSMLPVPVRGWSYHDELVLAVRGHEMSPIAEVSSSPAGPN